MAEKHSDEELSSDEEEEFVVKEMKRENVFKNINGVDHTSLKNSQLESLSSKINFNSLTPKESSVTSIQAENKFNVSIKKQDDNRYIFSNISWLEFELRTKAIELQLN